MKRKTAAWLLLLVPASCLSQIQPGLCPTRIETPEFPVLARQTRIFGKVTLAVTIDADGVVQRVDVAVDNPREKVSRLLQNSAVENMKRWKFSKPPTAPYMQQIVYDYEPDASLPPSGGPKASPKITRVIIDLPGRVNIFMNDPMIDTSVQKPSSNSR